MGSLARTAILSAALLVTGCAFDWDTLDPRAVDAVTTGAGGQGGAPGSGGGTTTSSSTGGETGTGAGGTGTGGDATGGMAPGGNGPLFFDDFERPDGDAIGNAWIEKDDDAYALLDGRAQRLLASGTNYRNHMVHRPATEDVADVAISAELHVMLSTDSAQIFARAQGAEVPNSYDGYLIWLPSSTEAVLVRQEGTGNGIELDSVQLTSPVDASATHRMRLRVSGDIPVQIQGAIERFDGGQWQTLGAMSVTDTSPDAIVGPGTFGFTGGSTGPSYAFDNFEADAL